MKNINTHVHFTKMHGLGNDFMVIDATQIPFSASVKRIQSWANRHFGIGFDQLLVVELTDTPDVDFRYRIFNADGSEVQQCGNGARCFAKFVFDKGLTDKTEITVETASGVIVLYVEDNGFIRVNMGLPNFEPASLPFVTPGQALRYDVLVGEDALQMGAVSMGNPHAVIPVEDIAQAPVEKWGALMAIHPQFPEGVNVGFVEKLSEQHIKLRVYERGAAETLACGTGACAAMAVLRAWQQVAEEVKVSLPGGDLVIRWSGLPEDPLWMSGPAETVFEGSIPSE